jgi:small subunit ribosomal protein S18
MGNWDIRHLSNSKSANGELEMSTEPKKRSKRDPREERLDYKDPLALTRYITDGGKITPARISKMRIAAQRVVAGEVKKARNLALLPSGGDAYDNFYRVEAISPAPFDY